MEREKINEIKTFLKKISVFFCQPSKLNFTSKNIAEMPKEFVYKIISPQFFEYNVMNKSLILSVQYISIEKFVFDYNFLTEIVVTTECVGE